MIATQKGAVTTCKIDYINGMAKRRTTKCNKLTKVVGISANVNGLIKVNRQ